MFCMQADPWLSIGTYIAGTNGYSNGIVPILHAYDAMAHYVDQGGNKCLGAFAIYLEPWHNDHVEANADWSLFCPHEAPGLFDSWGEEFEALYEKYEWEGCAWRVIPAQKLWYGKLDNHTSAWLKRGTFLAVWQLVHNVDTGHWYTGSAYVGSMAVVLYQKLWWARNVFPTLASHL
ncbi:hypothetical protein F5141DRAFT_1231666 [Pisolithus sp. B1]|nr:hypothetical protein F5141DRAFT_1231666 [Pisolithus sp. B1]